jgi:predicted kinase
MKFSMPSALIVFAGLPGTGKSTLAEAAGRVFGWPVFSKDRLEAALWRGGLTREMGSGWAAYELLTTLAEQQLRLDQSAVLDSVAGRTGLRRQWRELAERCGAAFRMVECVCSNESLHRARLAGRQRGIPGWYELDWAEVERVRGEYEPLTDERLLVDMVRPLNDNLAAVLAYLRAGL